MYREGTLSEISPISKETSFKLIYLHINRTTGELVEKYIFHRFYGKKVVCVV